MTADPQSIVHENNAQAQNDAASYLAAILPELAKIARQSNIDDLSQQIDQAARVARKAMAMRKR